MNDDEVVQLIIKGIDQGATKLNKDVQAGLKGIETQAGATATGVNKISSAFTSLGSWIKAGFGIGIGQEIFHVIDDALGSLVRGFEGAISSGQSWLMTVKNIERATGMSSEQASEWAAVMERVGVPLGDVDRILSQLGRNLLENEDLFKRAGVATRDVNGHFLDTYTILTNLRKAFADGGQSIQMAGLAQELLARGGYQWLEVLQLNDAQWKAIAGDAAAAGQIVTDSQTAQAEILSRLQDRAQGVIQGLQATIFGAVAPALMTFVDSFATFIEQNTDRIAAFVANVANFVTGVIGGLFGLDFSTKTTAQSINDAGNAAGGAAKSFDDWASSAAAAKSGEDALTTSLNAQIKAIDKQIASIGNRSDALHAAMERARLDASLANAQQQLADLKGNAPFTQGLSNAEAQLARQKHAQDIIDAQKAVSDANGAITMFEADQSVAAERKRLEAKKASLQDELAAHKKAVTQQAAMSDYLTGVNVKNDGTIADKAKAMFDDITTKAQEFRDKGVAFAGDLHRAFDGIASAIGGVISGIGGISNALDHAIALLGTWLAFRVNPLLALTTSMAGDTPPRAGEGSQHIIDLLRHRPQLQKVDIASLGVYGQLVSANMTNAQAIAALIAAGYGHSTGGWVGLNGPEVGVFGEDGPEYVVKNADLGGRHPSAGASPMSPAPSTTPEYVPAGRIQIVIPGLTQALFEFIDERLYIKAGNSPVGIQAFRGATRG